MNNISEAIRHREINRFFSVFSVTIILIFILAINLIPNETKSQQWKDERKKIPIGTDLSDKLDLLNYVKPRYPNLVNDANRLVYEIIINPQQKNVSFGGPTESLTPELNSILDKYSQSYQPLTGNIEQANEQDTFSLVSPVTGSEKIEPWSNNKPLEISSNPFQIWGNMNLYVNPYFQAFGGYPLGIPFDYENGVGLVVGLGTPYSGPMETDFVKLGLHFAIFEGSVTSRVKEFVKGYSSNQEIEVGKSSPIGNWNNLYAPHIGVDVAADIFPFLRMSYFFNIDTIDNETDPPVIVRDDDTDSPMPNNVVRSKGYFGAELHIRNLEILRSSYSNIYVARYLGEFHLGFIGREMMIDNFNFDTRLNFTLAEKRDFQILYELYFNNLFKGFGYRTVGLGASFRFGKTPIENFGIITAMFNLRIKVGDLFDPRLY